MQPGDRSLEVIVLAGRGLSPKVPTGSRRKVQLTLFSNRDPDGEAFGAKVSPWTEAIGRERALRFGASGLKCSFPLNGRRGAPSITSDPRFAESAHLRVRLFASSVSSKNSVIQTAAALLPTSVMEFASQEVDEATAQLEAEVSVPLTNIVSGRVGHAADRALGGWVPLHCCLDDDGELLIRQPQDDLPISLWMQMYVLPDHAAMVPKLHAQLLEETSRQPQMAAAPAAAQALPKASGQPKAGGYAQTANPPAVWGPSSAGKKSGAQTVEDLIDVTLEDSHEPVNLLDDIGSLNLLDGSDNRESLPTVQQGLPCVSASSTLPTTSGFSFVNQQAPQSTLPVASGFGFVNQQPQFTPQLPAQPAQTGTSAFGFIAGGSGPASPATLDLAALYANSEPVKSQPQGPMHPSDSKFSALVNFSSINGDQKTGGSSAKVADNSSLASLVADLKI